jgi:hypothetical protein
LSATTKPVYPSGQFAAFLEELLNLLEEDLHTLLGHKKRFDCAGSDGLEVNSCVLSRRRKCKVEILGKGHVAGGFLYKERHCSGGSHVA